MSISKGGERKIIFFDDDHWQHLLPLTYLRPIVELRVGLLSIKEKWLFRLGGEFSYITRDHLSVKYPICIHDDNIMINSTLLPTNSITNLIFKLKPMEAIMQGDELLAARIPGNLLQDIQQPDFLNDFNINDISGNGDYEVRRVTRVYHIFQFLSVEISEDISVITQGRLSLPLSSSNRVVGNYPVFLEHGAVAECAIFNTTHGPIYIGRNAEVMEGSLIRGPFAIGEGSVVKMGAKIYGPTASGPYCKLGGEINNSMIQGYSNKSHDGYLGNSVIGEWCNLGADTNNSNLKNNYLPVKLWSYVSERFENTGLQFCGLIMGDHSKTAINTMFNTGTVIGNFVNIFGEGFPRNFVPSFSWGGTSGYTTHPLEKAIETARIVMSRKGFELSDEDIAIFTHLFEVTSDFRNWERKPG